jgi:hypothetical protein
MYRRPFNDSIFDLRYKYETVFPDFVEDDKADDGAKQSVDSSKIYKIKYTINLLPQIGTHVNEMYVLNY